MLESVSKCVAQQDFVGQKSTEIEIALEEALVNIIKYAYKTKPGNVSVSCMQDDKGRFVIEIEDKGPPFDVQAQDRPHLPDNLAERKIGGLGVHFIKSLMTEVHYLRDGDRNLLRLIP
jgi:anti-sigma regulatory factor (Ser/Thr protein kinase)